MDGSKTQEIKEGAGTDPLEMVTKPPKIKTGAGMGPVEVSGFIQLKPIK